MSKHAIAGITDLVKGQANYVVTPDSFNFLDQTGRKLFWQQGFKGQGVIIAVLDSGVKATHPELTGTVPNKNGVQVPKVLPGRRFSTMGNPDSNTTDLFGHGTHVAATEAGKVSCGVAPYAQILPVKVLDDSGFLFDAEWLFGGLRYVRDWRGTNNEKVDIVSMSLGGSGFTTAEIATMNGLIQELNAMGILVIASSGNTGTEQAIYPAALDSVIAVGAVDVNRQLAYFSTTGNQVDLCQIGVDVISADIATDGYIPMSGTSMAQPQVAGIAALMISKDKALNGQYNTNMAGSALELCYYQMLRGSAIDIFTAGNDKQSGAGFCTLNQRLLTEVKFTQNSANVIVNGVAQTMDAPCIVSQDRTYVPVRPFGGLIGGTIGYDNTLKMATFTI